jgi:hypothetical protein
LSDEENILSQEERESVIAQLSRMHTHELDNRFFEVVTSFDDLGVYVTVTLRDQRGSFFYPVEARIAYQRSGLSKPESCYLLLEIIDEYLDEYLKDGVFLPIDWSDYTYEGHEVQLKGQILNLEVEGQAEEFLRQHQH